MLYTDLPFVVDVHYSQPIEIVRVVKHGRDDKRVEAVELLSLKDGDFVLVCVCVCVYVRACFLAGVCACVR